MRKVKPVAEYPLGALKIEPRWNGKFFIKTYEYSGYSNEFYWYAIADEYGTLYFDTKREALNRIKFMGLQDKYIEEVKK